MICVIRQFLCGDPRSRRFVTGNNRKRKKSLRFGREKRERIDQWRSSIRSATKIDPLNKTQGKMERFSRNKALEMEEKDHGRNSVGLCFRTVDRITCSKRERKHESPRLQARQGSHQDAPDVREVFAGPKPRLLGRCREEGRWREMYSPRQVGGRAWLHDRAAAV